MQDIDSKIGHITKSEDDLFLDFGYTPMEAEKMEAETLYQIVKDYPDVHFSKEQINLLGKYYPSALSNFFSNYSLDSGVADGFLQTLSLSIPSVNSIFAPIINLSIQATQNLEAISTASVSFIPQKETTTKENIILKNSIKKERFNTFSIKEARYAHI